MLHLSRKQGESVVINGNIEVFVQEIRGKSVKLGFNFPSGVTVLRQEIFKKIQEENRSAAEKTQDLLELLKTHG